MIFQLKAQTSEYYIGSNVTAITSDAFIGQQNSKIFQIDIKVGGGGDSIKVTKFNLTLKGTTTHADVQSAKLFYTGSKDFTNLPLQNADTVGSSVKSPPTKFTITLDKKLARGDNYFWITYQVSPSAVAGDFLDGTVDSITVADTIRAPSNSNPAGKKAIITYASYCPIRVKFKSVIFKDYIGIREVKIGSAIDNISPDLDTLTFYKQSIPVYRRESFPVSIKYGKGYGERIRAWVDWNNDGYMENSELVFKGDSLTPGSVFTATLNIPCAASVGLHKIRIVSDYMYSPVPGPCSDLYQGDGEEYLIDVQPDPKPLASFTVDTPLYVGSPIHFKNTSTAKGPTSYLWDYNYDGVYDDTTMNGATTFTSAGLKIVRLWMFYKGCDTSLVNIFIDTINVIQPQHTPVSDFIALQDTGTINTHFILKDLTHYKPNRWLWSIRPDSNSYGFKAYTFLSGTSAGSQNPVIQFNDTGRYSVSLTTWNNKGQGTTQTINAYIHVLDEVDMCRIPGRTDTITTNAGILFDDGGPDASYGPNQSCRMVIKPPCAKAIYLSFSSFDASIFSPSSGGDYFRVYDGIDNTGIPLHSRAGFPNGFQNSAPDNSPITIPTLKASSGSIYIEWKTDGFFTGDGFQAHWYSELEKETPPKASFSAPDSIYRNQTVQFYNTSTGPDLRYFWDFDGDGRTDNTDANPYYPYFVAGTYTVRLIVRNCSGIDTTYRTLIVKKPTSAPNTQFKADYLRVAVDDIIHLTDQSTQGPYEWNWSSLRTDGRRLMSFYQSDFGSQNPMVYFTDTGKYSITLGATNEFGTTYKPRPKYISVFGYCLPSVSNPSRDLGISRVNLSNLLGDPVIQYKGGDNNGYAHPRMNAVPYLYTGGVFKIRMSRISNFNKLVGKVWIDYNSDGDFDDPGENVLLISNCTDTFWQGKFTVPLTAAAGITRMRVGTEVNVLPLDPCGDQTNGEFVDFTIYIGPDSTRPVISLLGKDTVPLEEERLYVDPGFKAMDNADGDITPLVVTTNNIDPLYPGFYNVWYNVKDKAGNAALTVSRTIKLIPDSTKPTIILKGDPVLYTEVYQSFKDPGVIVTDNILDYLTEKDSGYVDTSQVGTYTKYYIATDARDNRQVVSRKIIVGDTTRPSIRLNGPALMHVQVYTAFNDPGVEISDNYNQNLSPVITSNVDTAHLGYYRITYSVSDSSGNGPVSVSRIVRVIDTVRPILHMKPQEQLWNVNTSPYIPPAYSVEDNYFPANKIELITTGGLVNEFRTGIYAVKFYARDSAGNHSDTVPVVVYVQDTSAPTLTLIGPTFIYLHRWEEFIEPGYYYSDNYDTKPILDITGTFKNTQSPGIFDLNYQVRDHSGNLSPERHRVIYVMESYDGVKQDSGQDITIQLFPNPARDKLYFQLGLEHPEKIRYTIINALGQGLIQQAQIIDKQRPCEINLENLAAGLYTLHVEYSGKSISRPFLISR